MYATKEDLAAFLGIDATAITAVQERTLESADDIIKSATFSSFDSSRISHVDATKRATLLQFEYITLMPQIDVIGSVKSIASGSFNMQMDSAISELAPRAKRVLFNAGLMYRGVSSR